MTLTSIFINQWRVDFRFPFGYILPETNFTKQSEDALTSQFSDTLNYRQYDWNSITII